MRMKWRTRLLVETNPLGNSRNDTQDPVPPFVGIAGAGNKNPRPRPRLCWFILSRQLEKGPWKVLPAREWSVSTR